MNARKEKRFLGFSREEYSMRAWSLSSASMSPCFTHFEHSVGRCSSMNSRQRIFRKSSWSNDRGSMDFSWVSSYPSSSGSVEQMLGIFSLPLPRFLEYCSWVSVVLCSWVRSGSVSLELYFWGTIERVTRNSSRSIKPQTSVPYDPISIWAIVFLHTSSVR